MEKIYIKYWPDAHRLKKISQGDWIDLYTYKDISLAKGERTYIPLGVAMRVPDGYESHMAPRSSTFKNWGILQTNSVAIIDNSYSGDDDMWMLPVYATKDIFIPKDTRLCQFRIIKQQPQIEFEEVTHLGVSRGGFGSTGV